MPAKIVDLSARSEIIREEPFGLHFWECEPKEFLEFLQDPRGFLAAMGIKLPKRCRIETTIENHDWISRNTRGLTQNGGGIVCNVGGGNVGIERDIYRVISYGHTHELDRQVPQDPAAQTYRAGTCDRQARQAGDPSA